MVITVNTISTKPFEGQKPGTSGLRKKVSPELTHSSSEFIGADRIYLVDKLQESSYPDKFSADKLWLEHFLPSFLSDKLIISLNAFIMLISGWFQLSSLFGFYLNSLQ